MADKKRPKHTKLFVPGVDGAKGKKAKKAKVDKPAPKAAHAATTKAPQTAQPPTGNAVAMPRRREDIPAIQKKRHKRRMRRVRALALVLGFLLLVALYFSQAYLFMVVKGAEWLEGARVGLQSGSGFPLEFEMPGYKDAQPIGTGAFAVLGEKDMAIVSDKGQELYRIQHGYANPVITTGNARVAVYNRDGTSYTIEGRDRRLQSVSTDQSILFCEMSPGGNLAVVTYSRYRFTLRVYDYVMSDEPLITVPYVDEYPYMLSFLSDDKHFALAALSVEGGARRTTIQFLHTGRSDVQATVDAGEAIALQMHYLSGSRLLVVYDSYTALYDTKGNELARYDYGGMELYTADTTGSITALVFSPVSHNQLVTVLLDSSLKPTGEARTESSDQPRVLVSGKTVLLCAGYYVYSYSITGEELAVYESASATYGLVQASQLLLLSSGQIYPLNWMLRAGGTPPEAEASGLPAGTTSLIEEGATSLPEETTSLSGEETSLPQQDGAGPPESTTPEE